MRPHRGHAPEVTASDTAVADITNDRDVFAFERSKLFFDGQHIEERLRRMFVRTVASIHDDGLAVIGKELRHARPLVTEEVVRDAMHTAALYKCAAPAVPLTDTVKETAGESVIRTLDRSRLAAVQTPQAFVPEIIKAALTLAVKNGVEYTDDCAAVEAMGISVRLSEGSQENIKITRPLDIQTAAAILKSRGE